MTKAVNMHLTCAASSGHGFQPVALSDSHSPWALASVCLLSVTHPCIHLPALLCSRPITALPRSYERSDSCPPGSSALPSMNSGSCYEQVSLIHALDLPIPPSPTTSQSPNVAFARYPSARRSPAFAGLGFALRQQARRYRPAESSSLSYGWIVHLLLLPTPPHGDAVAFGFRPESVCLERTFTSLIMCALRRTGDGQTRRKIRDRNV